jgi:hypothetical protein
LAVRAGPSTIDGMDTLIEPARGVLRPRPVAFGLLVPLVLVLALGRAPDASAVVGTVNVTVEGVGRVTGDGISCPGDCSDQAAWRDDQSAPRVTLTAGVPLPGHRLEWEGCTVSGARPRECTATYSEEGTAVTARFVDRVAPQVSLDLPGNRLFGPKSGPARLEATASDDQQVARVEFSDGPTPFATVLTAPWNAERKITARPDGPFALRATAFDAAGNSAAAESTAVYDATPPTVVVEGPRERWVNGTAATATIAWSATDPHPAEDECRLLPPGETMSVPMTCARPLTVNLPRDGRYRVFVGAWDSPRNQRTETVTLNVDRVAPAVPQINEGPAEGSVISSGIRVLFGAPGETDHTWDCRIDGVATACPNGLLTAPGAEGPVEVSATLRDAAGNASGPAVRRFTIDRTPPTAILTEGPAEGATVAAGVVPFAWTVTDATALTVSCAWDAGTATPCAGGRVERTLTAGEHRFELRVVDAAGHARVVQRRFVVRAATPPPGGGNPGGDPGVGEPGGGAPGDSPVGGGLPGGGPLGGGFPGGGAPAAKRCTVPRVKRGATPKQVRQQLTRAGCRVRTKQVRSAKVRRGRVVRLSRKPSTTLPYRTTIVVSVSRGR